MYIKRELYKIVTEVSQTSPVIMLTGPRQAGKTTLLRHTEPERRFVTLDDLEVRSLAKNDPKMFLERFPPPVLIDEFQYAPEILPYIKIYVDEKRTRLSDVNGSFWLTGSQNFTMMKGVQESLAGRVTILNLLGLSRKEIEKDPSDTSDFLATAALPFETTKGIDDIFAFIIKGDKPELWANPQIDREVYYRSYVQTYIERDVTAQLRIKDVGLFEKFMRLLAGRTGQLVNLASLAVDVGVSVPTIRSWMTALERSFQIILLPPYYRNIGKRSLKTPKVYFLDMGLVCYFLKLSGVQDAITSHLSGPLFENWVVTEIMKSYWFRGKYPGLYFWRTKDGDEIDLLYESAGKLYPTEIKLSSSPKREMFDTFEKLAAKSGFQLGRKKIICTSKINLPIDENSDIVSALSII